MAEDRSYVTWKTFVDERLKALGISIRYLVSDRAKALIQLAEKGLECLSMPDFFHVVHELIKAYSSAIGQRLHQAHKQLEAAEHALARQRERTPVAPASSWAQPAVEASRTEVTTVGRGPQQLSASPGNPLTDTASFHAAHLYAPDLGAGAASVTRGHRRH